LVGATKLEKGQFRCKLGLGKDLGQLTLNFEGVFASCQNLSVWQNDFILDFEKFWMVYFQSLHQPLTRKVWFREAPHWLERFLAQRKSRLWLIQARL
jgi:hypothetical protein